MGGILHTWLVIECGGGGGRNYLFPLFLSYNKTVSFTYRGFYESTAMPRSVKIVRALGCQFAVIVQ